LISYFNDLENHYFDIIQAVETKYMNFKRSSNDIRQIQSEHDASQKFIFLKTCLFILLLFFFFRNFIPFQNDLIEASDSNLNHSGNIANGGLIAKQGNQIFFSNLHDGGKLYKANEYGIMKTKLTDDKANFIHILLSNVYYVGENDYLYKLNINNGERISLTQFECLNVQIIKEWIYVVHATNHQLYKLRLDGSDLQKVFDVKTMLYAVSGNWIYYSNEDDYQRIYKLALDGSQILKLIDDKTDSVQVQGDWIFFRNLSDGNKLYKMKLDGSSKKRLTDDQVAYLNLYGKWIFYQNINDKNTLYKVNLNGHTKTKIMAELGQQIHLTDQWIYYVTKEKFSFQLKKIKWNGEDKTNLFADFEHINGDWIYFTYLDKGKKLYKMKLNGSDLKKLTDDIVGSNVYDSDWIYYVNLSKQKRIYKIDYEGVLRIPLTQVKSDILVLKEDWIYFMNQEDDNQLYKIKTDGTGIQLVQNEMDIYSSEP
jgi:hypothetical protein